MQGVNIEIQRVVTNQDNVYSEYNFNQVKDKQFFRAPYGGFRFDLKMGYFQECGI